MYTTTCNGYRIQTKIKKSALLPVDVNLDKLDATLKEKNALHKKDPKHL